MKKIIAVFVLAAFALVISVSADEAKPCDKDKPAEKGTCPAGGEKKGSCPKGGGEKECPAGKDKAPESK